MTEAEEWHKKYNEASQELGAANVEWQVAGVALARANARIDKAQREHARLFQERIAHTRNRK